MNKSIANKILCNLCGKSKNDQDWFYYEGLKRHLVGAERLPVVAAADGVEENYAAINCLNCKISTKGLLSNSLDQD